MSYLEASHEQISLPGYCEQAREWTKNQNGVKWLRTVCVFYLNCTGIHVSRHELSI